MVTLVTLPSLSVLGVHLALTPPLVTAPSESISRFVSSPLFASFLSGFTFTVTSPLCRVATLVFLSTTASLGRGVLVPGTVCVVAAGACAAAAGAAAAFGWARLIGGLVA